ncbi:hypothetical protein SK571_29140 [Lentzea sp. BCCO 10_0798]|uniref:Mce-associated membrane protein n=1 Tax=Lentzea kristufekii TaxID=3095430 RepID=A0ABU4U0A6_9PSEU|nr:hypothetical protein [Lentzea sp. BCCO 10_0798]MDX8053461.1 hypothetical protein [Lentzea sp. BCCO 10_0798]
MLTRQVDVRPFGPHRADGSTRLIVVTQPPYRSGPPQEPWNHQPPGQQPWGPPHPGPPKKKSPAVFVVLGLVAVLLVGAGVLGTGLLWPGWMKPKPVTSAAAVDQSTPESAAKAVEDALNRRDIDQFVNVLVCKDGRAKAEKKDISRAEEILYRDVEPLDPKRRSDAEPVFKLDEVRKIKPSDPVYHDGNKDATVAIMSVEYATDRGPEKRRGVLALFQEDTGYVVCEMGFVPVADSQEPPPDPDPNSPTGRVQAFAKDINAKDITARRPRRAGS